MPRVKTEAQERARLRAAEQRKAEHAYKTLDSLMLQHHLDERDTAELYAIMCRLAHAIKNQHIKDERYAQYKAKRIEVEGY